MLGAAPIGAAFVVSSNDCLTTNLLIGSHATLAVWETKPRSHMIRKGVIKLIIVESKIPPCYRFVPGTQIVITINSESDLREFRRGMGYATGSQAYELFQELKRLLGEI